MSNCGTGQFFYAGNDFSTATMLYSDANLTTPAPDAWYSIGGIYRRLWNGLLLSPAPCPACVIPCGQPFNFGGGGTGEYTIYFDMGNVPGAAIITFSPGVNNTTLFPIPDMCTWEYNGQTASEYSSLLGGYMTGIIGAPDGPPHGGMQCVINGFSLLSTLGTQGQQPTGTQYAWDQSSGNFVAGATILMGSNVGTLGYTGITNNTGAYQSTLLDWNCADLAAGTNVCAGGGLNVPPSPYFSSQPLAPNLKNPLGFPNPVGTQWNLSGGGYRGATMVIPSPPGVTNTILKVVVDGPCGNTWWGIDVQCPVELTAVMGSIASPLGTAAAVVCDLDATIPYYHVPVDAFGNSNPNSSYFDGSQFPAGGGTGQQPGVLGLNDWIFTDPYGEFPLANGVYKMTFDANDGGAIQDWIVEVGVLEYKDSGIYAPQTNPHALPPEDYINDPGATLGVQSTGTRIPGIVKSISLCSTVVTCTSSISGSGGTGQYELSFDATAAVGAVIVVFNPQSVPDRCEWTYDGTTKSEYSSPSQGYLQGLIGVYTGANPPGSYSCGGTAVSNLNGSSGNTYSGNTYTYDSGSNSFVNSGIPVTMGPYAPQASGGVSLTSNAPGACMMVIPKPNASPSQIDLLMDGPCGGTAWSISLNCPVLLNQFDSGPDGGSCCFYNNNIYTASVHTSNGISSIIQLHDWVFTDANGVNKKPAGIYPVDNNGTPYLITVSSDGIVTALSSCVCVPIPIACNSYVNGLGTGGKYKLPINATASTGAIIVTFNPSNIPDKCSWIYDGTTKSEYSSPVHGYLEGVIGIYQGANPPGSYFCGGNAISNLNGSSGVSYGGNIFDYIGGAFVDTGVPTIMGPYAPQSLGGVDLRSVQPGACMMVIPKPNASPSLLDLEIEAPCGSTGWDIQVNCPTALNSFLAGVAGASCSSYTTTIWTASVYNTDGMSSIIQLHDWVFSDVNGVTKKPAGIYPVEVLGVPKFVTVSSEGVVTNIVGC